MLVARVHLDKCFSGIIAADESAFCIAHQRNVVSIGIVDAWVWSDSLAEKVESTRILRAACRIRYAERSATTSRWTILRLRTCFLHSAATSALEDADDFCP